MRKGSLRDRLVGVLDLGSTLTAARLAGVLCLLDGVVLLVTAWPVAGALDGAPVHPLLVVGSAHLVLALAAPALPWRRLDVRWALVLPAVSLGLLCVLGAGAGRAGSPYIPLLTLWLMVVGLTQQPVAALAFLLPSVGAWLLLVGPLDAASAVRLALTLVVWVVLVVVLSVRTGRVGEQTALLRTQLATDPLTGLPNRRALDVALANLVPGDVVAVLDVDHFKQVNDSQGHEGGDAVLVALAAVLRAGVRTVDLVGRHGGEEFVLVLRTGPAAGSVASVLLRLRAEWHRAEPGVTWSAGVAVHGPGCPAGQALRAADDALYAAKRAGRDRVLAASADPRLAGLAQVGSAATAPLAGTAAGEAAVPDPAT